MSKTTRFQRLIDIENGVSRNVLDAATVAHVAYRNRLVELSYKIDATIEGHHVMSSSELKLFVERKERVVGGASDFVNARVSHRIAYRHRGFAFELAGTRYERQDANDAAQRYRQWLATSLYNAHRAARLL